MGYLFNDLSGWYLQQFNNANLDFYKKISTESAYIHTEYNTDSTFSTIPVDVDGTDYVYNDEFELYPTDTWSTPSTLMDRFPFGEWRIQVKYKGRYIAMRGKFYYTSDTFSQPIITHKYFWVIFGKVSVYKSDTDALFSHDWGYLYDNFTELNYQRFFYNVLGVKDNRVTPNIVIHNIDFSQCFAEPTTPIVARSVYACITPPRIYMTLYDVDMGGEQTTFRPYYRFGYLISATRDGWSYNEPGPEPYIYDRKGRFPGMPTSTIPLRQTIPSGIDYRHYITVYDETNYNARNMFLTNKVGDIPYTLIDYTVPRGRLRVATDLQFTHFVCCSFTSDNMPRIYRITSYHVLGDNLIEYDFEMDGLKDYFQHQGITTDNNFLVGRCTISSKWNKLLKDTAFYDGTFTDYVVTGSTVYNYYAMNCPGGIYVLNETAFREFCTWLTVDAAQYSAAIVGQISSVYIVPYTENNNIYASHPNTLTFSLAAEPFAMTFETTGTIYRYNVSLNVGRYNDYVECSLESCAEIIETFREMFDSNATIHVPFYGDFTPSLDILSRLATGSVNIRYYVSPVDGNLSISFYPYVEVLPVVGLPSRTLPVNSSVSAVYSINRDQALSNTMNTATGVVGIGKGVISNLATGNVGGAVASVLGGAVDMKLNEYNINKSADNSRQTISERQGVTTVTGTGGGAIMCREVYISFQVPNLSIDFDDLFSSIGYPVQKLWTSIGATSGGRYYVQMLGKVKGAQWYSDLVMGDIQSDYIVYNY